MEPDRQETDQNRESQPILPSQEVPAPSTPAPEFSTMQSQSSTEPIVPAEVEPSTGINAQNPTPPISPTSPTISMPATSPMPPTSPGIPIAKKSRKKWIFGGVIVAILVILIGGGASAYFLWYQNPQKVLTDSFVGLLNAKTSKTDTKLTAKESDGSLSMDVATQTASDMGQVDVKANGNFSGTPVSLNASMVYQRSGDSYVKLDGLGKLVDQVASGVTLPQSVNDLVAMVDGKWIAISDSDLQNISSESKDTKECFDSLSDKITKDKSYTDEISTAYRNHMFIEVKDKLGVKNGNVGYVIKGNEDQFIAFLKDVEKSKLYKAALDCEKKSGADIPSDFSLSDEAKKSIDQAKSDTNTGDTTFQVWISQFSHQLKETNISGSSDGTDISIDTTYDQNTKVSIAKPSDATSLDKVKAAIDKVVQDFTGSDTTDMTVDPSQVAY